jgi:hypothetical protein
MCGDLLKSLSHFATGSRASGARTIAFGTQSASTSGRSGGGDFSAVPIAWKTTREPEAMLAS